MDWYVILNDGSTFTSIDGCKAVGVYELNEKAQEAADNGDGETLLKEADQVIDLKSEILDS